MDCLAIFESGNYTFNICRILESRGYVFELISTPCQIAKGGCGYCLKFPIEYKDLIINVGNECKTPVIEMFKIIPQYLKNKYEKIYPMTNRY